MAENVFCGQCIGRWRDIRAVGVEESSMGW
jgi:hypothetical protein